MLMILRVSKARPKIILRCQGVYLIMNGFRMLASKSFKKSSASLCDAIAMLPKRLCTELVDPATIEPILASQLIPLDKGNGESER